ncbi:unnamed protein product, partial [Rotaria sordida]
HRLDLISYSLRGDALQWFKNNKSALTTWSIFVQEIKKAFTSSFSEELAFKTLESYTQGENQSIRNFYNEVLKLCNAADSGMSESTKLKNLLNKVKPSIQLEVRKKKSKSTAEFLEFAKEVEELLQFSNLQIDTSTHRNLNPVNSNIHTSSSSFFPSTRYNNSDYYYTPSLRRNFGNNAVSASFTYHPSRSSKSDKTQSYNSYQYSHVNQFNPSANNKSSNNNNRKQNRTQQFQNSSKHNVKSNSRTVNAVFPSNSSTQNDNVNSSDSHKNETLDFRNYHSKILISNTTMNPKIIRKGARLGYLLCCSMFQDPRIFRSSLYKSLGATRRAGMTPASSDFLTDKCSNNDSVSSCQAITQLHSYSQKLISNPTSSIDDIVVKNINSLVVKIQDDQQKKKMLSLLMHFHSIFDTTKHNIARTPIPHVINTVPHSPPASRPYPQPDKEEAMYQLIQDFLEAGLITESNSPYAAPAILVKKKDQSFRLVVDYKRLNGITIKDTSPLPNMEDTIQ